MYNSPHEWRNWKYPNILQFCDFIKYSIKSQHLLTNYRFVSSYVTQIGSHPTYHPLYNSMVCLDGTGIADVESSQPFHILNANFGWHAMDFLPHQVAAYSSEQQQTIIESDINHKKMFGLKTSVDTNFLKGHVNAHCDDQQTLIWPTIKEYGRGRKTSHSFEYSLGAQCLYQCEP